MLFEYNGIQLPYPDVTDFSEEAVQDESDTDWMLMRLTIRVRCQINPDYLAMLAPDLLQFGATSTNAADLMKVLRYRLLLKRKPFTFSFNGKTYTPSAQVGNQGHCDAKNGPEPKSCRYFEVTTQTFIMEYAIVAHYWENPSAVSVDGAGDPSTTNRQGSNVISNKWTETVEMDELQMTRRIRQGKYFIRSDNVDAVTADELRSRMSVVSVPKKFLRESSNYTVSPDGLSIAYTVVDKEQFKMPPPPAYRAEGYYFERTVTMGARRIGEVRVLLEGGKNSDQTEMIRSAIQMANAYLNRRSSTLPPPDLKFTTTPGWNVLDDAGLKIDFWRNRVEFYMRVWAAVDIFTVGAIDAFYQVSTVVPSVDDVPNYTPAYMDRGSARLLLRAAAYYDPSFRNTELGQASLRDTDNAATTVEDAQLQLNNGALPGTMGKTQNGSR